MSQHPQDEEEGTDDKDDDDDDDDEDADSWVSEDDPNRLWCICQKPHNNRLASTYTLYRH